MNAIVRHSANLEFNNALIEVYDSKYKTMGFHSDQALDIKDNSYIAIYSSYKYPHHSNRTLIVKNKSTEKVDHIRLLDNTVVLFSTETNQQYQHKIILDSDIDNIWLGITFRMSKTNIEFINDIPFLQKELIPLTLANDIEKIQFYKERKIENNIIGHKYPFINFTISPSDLLRPVAIVNQSIKSFN